MDIRDKIRKQAMQADLGWGSAYGLFSSVIREKGLKKGAEIGVAYGGHSEAMLRQTDIDRLYGVDPYSHQDGYDDPMNLPQAEFDALCEFTLGRLAPYGERFKLIRDVSENAVKTIPIPLDFVYIDAVHTYEGVWNDLCTWYGKIREGGVIGGHDYAHPNFPGVKDAIDRFFSRLEWQVHTEGEGVWWVEKRPINVSFFIPAFNCATTLVEAVESITMTNLSEGDELIIVNDGSNDDTEVVISKLAEKNPAIKALRHTGNKGGAAARNTAVEAATRPLLFCLDSDNILEHSSISPLKDFLVSSGADVAAFRELHYFSHDKKKSSHKWILREGLVTLADYFAGPVVPGASGNYMFTKQSWLCAGGYPEFAGALDAWGFGLRQVASGQKMIVMPGLFYYHRQGHESYWVREAKRGRTSLTALQILIPYLDQIETEDVDYIMAPEGRYTWFENLETRPIRVKSMPQGTSGHVGHGFLSRAKHAARSMIAAVRSIIR